eukprot:6443224-Karenia_brevis.AAC.1
MSPHLRTLLAFMQVACVMDSHSKMAPRRPGRGPGPPASPGLTKDGPAGGWARGPEEDWPKA